MEMERRSGSKREENRQRNREAIKAAAWTVFATKGLDASTVRDIVAASGVSIGTFYNYYGTREAVFHEILDDLADQIRSLSGEARAHESEIEPMLAQSYRGFLEFILGLDGALDFCALNQHHIRSRLFTLTSTGGLLSDIERDMVRVMPAATLSASERTQAACLIVANALEVLLQSRNGQPLDIDDTSRFITRLIVRGIGSWDRQD
ncbi:transcriptional regulator, TetR family [Rhizobium sp. RU35A]|nr:MULTISPECIES: TetR/AcrR family transcriptional regulator [Rhizobium]SIQ87956.1 transcriptional regulator, TetR family [Rhizobium sp. RU35A]